jgi:predicted transcriptional regulator
MTSSTSVAVSPEVRDALRELARERGDTMDSLLRRLLRDEKARRIGVALEQRRAEMTGAAVADEQALLNGSLSAVNRAIG